MDRNQPIVTYRRDLLNQLKKTYISAMVAKKLLVEDKITAWVKQVCLPGKVSNRKTLFGETFCFLEKRSLSIFNFVLRVTYCFLTRLAHNQCNFLGMYCSFFFDPIGQLCPGGPAYSSRTVSIISIRKQRRFISKLDQSQPHIHSKIMVLKHTTVKWSIQEIRIS